MEKLDRFTYAYIECALWSSMDESDPETGGEPMDANYSIDDLAPTTLAKMVADCADFQEANAAFLDQAYDSDAYGNDEWPGDEQAGHDFWLTRNGHGAGFWDRGLPGELGDILTKASHAYGSCNLYVGDDGLIYAR